MGVNKNNKVDIMFPLKGLPVRRQYATVDIETKDGETQNKGFTRPFLAGYYDGKKFVCFDGSKCLEAMLGYLLRSENDGMVYYAHFGGAFDWLHFLPYIAASGYHFEIMTVCSKIQMILIKPSQESKKKGWTFLDSYQLIPSSLKKVTEAFNTDVKKQEFDLDSHEDDPRWIEYLRDDCVSLYQTLTKFHELVEGKLGGEVGITTASTAMKTYRRSYQCQPIMRHSAHHEFFRKAYYGGRVEIYMGKCDDLHYYDINSSYPNAMLQKMPVGNLSKWEGTPPDYLRNTRVGFARCTVSVPVDTYIPVLPYRAGNGRLIFPVGEFTGVWDAVEIDRAIECGAKVEWHESYWIHANNVFTDFIEKMYRFRDKSREGYEEAIGYTAKIMMNSLYGKFATNTLRDKIVMIEPGEEPPEKSTPLHPLDDDCLLYSVEEEISAPYIIPQISAHITALGRVHLHKLATYAHQHGKLAYMDTDSIMTTSKMNSYLSSGLGGLKDEGAGVTYSGEFLQPKLYRLVGSDGSDKIVMKGYHNRSTEAFDTIKRGGTLTYDTLEKIGAMCAKKMASGPEMKTITKCMRGSDTKRIWDGNSTRPIIINEFEDESWDFRDE